MGQPSTVALLMSYAHSTAFHRDAFAGAARGPACGFVSSVQPVKRASLSEPNGEPNDAEIAEQVRVEMNRIAEMKKLGLSLADPRTVYASRHIQYWGAQPTTRSSILFAATRDEATPKDSCTQRAPHTRSRLRISRAALAAGRQGIPGCGSFPRICARSAFRDARG